MGTFFKSEPTPKPCALPCDLLYQQVQQTANRQDGQNGIDQGPKDGHDGESRFFQTVAHHGFGFSTESEFAQHGCVVHKVSGILGA
jgi:hypothetical protein